MNVQFVWRLNNKVDSFIFRYRLIHVAYFAYEICERDMAEAGADLADELLAYCRQHLSALKCPRSIDFEAELPRHPTGKLYKRLLRDRYWQGRESRIV